MKPLHLKLSAGALILAGLLLLGLALSTPIPVVVDGQASLVRSPALTAGGVLRSAGAALGPGDRLRPASQGAFFYAGPVQLERAVPVSVWTGGASTGLLSAERIPANLLLEAGIRLYPGDRLLVNGRDVDPSRPLAAGEGSVLQVRPAVLVTLVEAGQARAFASAAPTLGDALWEAGIRVGPEDRLEPPLDTPLTHPLQASLKRAVPLAIQLQDQVLPARSAAATVGEALARAGVALQGLDYAVPAEGAPLPADGRIRVVRVRESALLAQVQVPFKSEYQPDPQTELDQKSILQAGVTGLIVTRTRVRTEDGQEVARKQEAEWVAREPKTQVVGYGTQAVLHTETVDGVTIEYWRKVTAYATSYTACSAGSCDGRTASGQPVSRGVVAVIRSWYNMLRGQQVYIPGYGQAAIADIGAGVPGQNWIDLGYGEGDYVPWHSNVTVYFLAPIPANVPWNLP